jgi:hypothetical protein
MGIKGEKKALSFIEDAAIPTEVLINILTQSLDLRATTQRYRCMRTQASA